MGSQPGQYLAVLGEQFVSLHSDVVAPHSSTAEYRLAQRNASGRPCEALAGAELLEARRSRGPAEVSERGHRGRCDPIGVIVELVIFGIVPSVIFKCAAQAGAADIAVSTAGRLRRAAGAVEGAVRREARMLSDKIVERPAGKFTSLDIHKALFPDGPPKRRSLKELRKGIEDYIMEQHERGRY